MDKKYEIILYGATGFTGQICCKYIRDNYPDLIWAIFFVILIGLGPVSGVMAMTFYTIGYLGKLQYETCMGFKIKYSGDSI